MIPEEFASKIKDEFKDACKSWKIRVLEYNTFNGQIIVQILKNDEVRGSFTINEDEDADRDWWISLFSYVDKLWKNL